MPKVLLTEKARIELHVFIRNYEESFVELYTDSGIENEDEIIENFLQSGRSLYQKIRNTIAEKLSPKKVFGRKPIGDVNELSFFIGHRLIIVFFSDNSEANERWVESIFINKKPIIF